MSSRSCPRRITYVTEPSPEAVVESGSRRRHAMNASTLATAAAHAIATSIVIVTKFHWRAHHALRPTAALLATALPRTSRRPPGFPPGAPPSLVVSARGPAPPPRPRERP